MNNSQFAELATLMADKGVELVTCPEPQREGHTKVDMNWQGKYNNAVLEIEELKQTLDRVAKQRNRAITAEIPLIEEITALKAKLKSMDDDVDWCEAKCGALREAEANTRAARKTISELKAE